MPEQIVAVYDNTIAQMEAIVCDRAFDGVKQFVHDVTVYDAEEYSTVPRPTRKFMLVPTGQRSLGGTMMQDRLPGEVDDVLLLMVLYKQGSRPVDLYKAIMTDFDRITYQLSLTDNFEEPTTKMSRRLVGTFSPVFDPDGANGVAVITAPIGITYLPTF